MPPKKKVLAGRGATVKKKAQAPKKKDTQRKIQRPHLRPEYEYAGDYVGKTLKVVAKITHKQESKRKTSKECKQLEKKSREFEEGMTVRWLVKEGFDARIPLKSKCQGCHNPASMLIEYMRQCDECKVSTVLYPITSLYVQVPSEAKITVPRDDYADHLQLKNPQSLLDAVVKAANPCLHATTIIAVRLSMLQIGKPPGHAMVLFIYVDSLGKTVDTRIFDSNIGPTPDRKRKAHSSSGSNRQQEEAEEDGYESVELIKGYTTQFLHDYLAVVIPDYLYRGQNYGESCPIALQASEGPGVIKAKIMLDNMTRLQEEFKRRLDEAASAESEEAKGKTKQGRKKNAKPNEDALDTETVESLLDTLKKIEKTLEATKGHHYDWAVDQSEDRSHIDTAKCYVKPAGFCEGWASLLTLLQVVFPTVPLDTLILDVAKHHIVVAPTLHHFIARFSYNLYKKYLALTNLPAKPSCCNDAYGHHYTDDDTC